MNRLTLSASFLPGDRSTPRRHVDAPRLDGLDGVGDVVGVEAAGEDQPHPLGHLAGQRPVEDLARTRASAASSRIRSVASDAGVGDLRRAGRVGLDDPAHRPGDLGDDVGGLVAVELGRLDAGPVDELDDPLRVLVAEHADGEDLRRQPAGDVVGLLRRRSGAATGRTRTRRRRRPWRPPAGRRPRW